MDKTFVRKDFYVNPPQSNASPEEWAAWLEADTKAARAAKAAFTRARNKCVKSDSGSVPQYGLAKVNGRYRQVVSLAFEGGTEGETGQIVPIAEAQQETTVEQAKQRLEAKSFRSHGKSNHQSRREAKRQARKAKYRR